MTLLLLLACRSPGPDAPSLAPTDTTDTADTAGIADAPFISPEETGPYSVGVTTITFTDPRGKELVAEVWYPAVPQSGEPDPYVPVPISRAAYRDAEPVGS